MPSDQNDSTNIEDVKDLTNAEEGNTQPYNKLEIKAQTEMAVQVPRSKPATPQKWNDQKEKLEDWNKEVSNKRKRVRSKSKYKNKRLKIKEKNNEDDHDQAKNEETKGDEELIIDLKNTDHKKQLPNLNESCNSRNFSKFSLDEQEKILSVKNSYFKLIFNKQKFRDFAFEVIGEIAKENVGIKFKAKSIYLIQHICEEYLVFWFSQIELISEFAKRKTVMKADSVLYDILIHRLLSYDNLTFIKEILKDTENSQSAKVQMPKIQENPDVSRGNNSQQEPSNQ